ncbi:D-ribose pyranase [Schinkia azotoformans]|uniref:D-ribose pyranase n=1 Tax=Schinkia azotoformans TaxID=1454 RepID=UPI00054D8059|nr:D-ribose pyranase [Schinkia azotoformans]MEC1695038.1 D-ribose pyranase [Schinkia azotoformans]MEC1716354.1 D-ribose pyranase [Schinkia azotoformans]MEC1726843.1 D-ribose pyranase [Schinkia azotoformans]MEC1740023.1 D-ribose pyranase [Schinkia azotoformans]MEC1746348.1 D-ribose pyranase [Schinkia azotoformans]
MKKNGILNSHIASVLAELGHTDTIVIADCGLPIPSGVKRIDLSLKIGVPSFLETLNTIIQDMEVEAAILATEIQEKNPGINKSIEDLLAGKELTYVSHEQFKELTKEAKVVIRTGEASPYANIILQAGVIF